MTKKHRNSNSRPLSISINGREQKLTDSQAIAWLDSLAKKMPGLAIDQGLIALNQNPSATRLRARYYQLLSDLEFKSELIALCRNFLVKHPRDAAALNYLAHGLRLSARVPEAIEILEKLCKLRPNDPVALNSLGSALKGEGDFARANEFLYRAIQIKPDYAVAYWNRSDITDTPEKDLAEIQKILNQNPPASIAHHLNFTVYRLQEKTGDTHSAFEYLMRGNVQKRSLLDYRIQEDLDIDTGIKNTFTKSFIDENIGEGFEEISPIFIFGMPRSGTTLVEQILASHSQVFGAGELSALGDATRTVLRKYRIKGPFPHSLKDLPKGSWREIGKTYAELVSPVIQGADIFTDKALLNFKTAGFIKLCLPNARLIMVNRNPMDVGFGCFRQLFNQGMRFSYQFDEIASYFNSFSMLADHWQSVLSDQIHFINYEELVTQPKTAIERLLQFVELQSEPGCFEPHKTERAIHSLSSTQVREPISKSNIDQWRRYEEQLLPLAAEFQKHGILLH